MLCFLVPCKCIVQEVREITELWIVQLKLIFELKVYLSLKLCSRKSCLTLWPPNDYLFCSISFFISHLSPLYLDASEMNTLTSDWIQRTPSFSLTLVLQKLIFCSSYLASRRLLSDSNLGTLQPIILQDQRTCFFAMEPFPILYQP